MHNYKINKFINFVLVWLHAQLFLSSSGDNSNLPFSNKFCSLGVCQSTCQPSHEYIPRFALCFNFQTHTPSSKQIFKPLLLVNKFCIHPLLVKSSKTSPIKFENQTYRSRIANSNTEENSFDRISFQQTFQSTLEI